MPNYLDNLYRLGILEIPPVRHFNDDSLYDEVRMSNQLNTVKERIELLGFSIDFEKKQAVLTDLGKQFCSACVTDKNLQIN